MPTIGLKQKYFLLDLEGLVKATTARPCAYTVDIAIIKAFVPRKMWGSLYTDINNGLRDLYMHRIEAPSYIMRQVSASGVQKYASSYASGIIPQFLRK